MNALTPSIRDTTGVLDLIMCAQRGLGNLREPISFLVERPGSVNRYIKVARQCQDAMNLALNKIKLNIAYKVSTGELITNAVEKGDWQS